MAFEVILFCFIWLASERPPPDERGVALYFGQTAAEDHLAGDPPHFPEIYGESCESAEDELVEGKVIVADQSHLLTGNKTGGGESFQQFRQPPVQAGS